MNLFRLLGKGVLLLVILFGLTACGQKGPLILPPKNATPQAVNPIIFPEQDSSGDQQPSKEGTESEDSQDSEEETPLGILPGTTRHKPMNAR
ncbi:MAG: lipoprotein [Oxalobacter sp.]